jgi:hypothetical protein
MDNGASFSAVRDGLGARPGAQAERLARVGRVPRALVEALRALTLAALSAAMHADPVGPLLSDAQLRAVLLRRDRVIEHVDAAIRERGESAVMAFP